MAGMTAPLALAIPRYVPHRPEPPQHAFLYLDELGFLEALYGGAAGGGKSDALLIGALRYVHVPRYAALLLRRTYPELTQADGLITRAEQWLEGTDATWNQQEHTWHFPSGARLQFGYLASQNDRLRYQGGAYQFIGFDELTQFRERDYRYLLSRLRRPAVARGDEPLGRVPLRMRAATNPGGPGHDWVRRRFIEWEPDPLDPEDPEHTREAFARRIFIPARLEDNPHLDQAAYRRSLAGLPRAEREQLLAGSWDVDTGDTVYPRQDVAAAIALGDELDRRSMIHDPRSIDHGSTIDPPAGPILFGIDWGEWTHGLIGYPLPHGGLYVTAGEELYATEPGVSTSRILSLADDLPAWPGRRPVRDSLHLVTGAAYDPGSAGAQSIRTFRTLARTRHPRLKTTPVPFGDYKREAISYLRWLMENSRAVLDGNLDRQHVGILAIGSKAPRLRTELRAYKKVPETGEPVKEDDHGPDALVALIADTARRHRDRGILERQRAHAAAARLSRLPTP
jgi:hypothetical protein